MAVNSHGFLCTALIWHDHSMNSSKMALRQNGSLITRTVQDISEFLRSRRRSTAVLCTAHTDRSRNSPGLLHADRHVARLFCFGKGHNFTTPGKNQWLAPIYKSKTRLYNQGRSMGTTFLFCVCIFSDCYENYLFDNTFIKSSV